MPSPAPEHAVAPLGARHHRVQRLRRLLTRRTARETERSFVVEGTKLLSEALDAGVAVESVYVAAGARDAAADRAFSSGVRVFELAPGVLERVAGTVTPQPVLAVVPYVDVDLDALRPDLVVVFVDVRDPGNAGTVLRAAGAAGASGLVSCDGSVDLYNPKTVRASAGALFRLPIVTKGEPRAVIEALRRQGARVLATVARGGEPYDRADLTGPVALALGNEASGLPEPVRQACDGAVTIPMAGGTESLNVGVTAAVLCFEVARQRRRGSGA